MQIPLYKALKSAKVPDENATSVVNAVEEYIAVKISEANKGLEAQTKALEAQNKGIEAQFKGVETQYRAQTWMIGTFGMIIAVASVAGALTKFIR